MKVVLRKKRNIIAIVAIVLVILIGATWAVSGDLFPFKNLFHVADYRTEFIENFTSPEDWKSCEEIPKTVVAKNETGGKIYVRLKYEEYWRTFDERIDLPLEKDGVRLAEIIFRNENDWELRDDGYYYYKVPLNPSESTSSLFKSVKLNCDANFGHDNICTEEATGAVCTKPADNYEGAKYHLKVTVQTIAEGGISSWTNPKHVADCDSNILYDAIACQTNGLDTDVDYYATTTKSSNGFGVNTYAPYADDAYPTYYFRGEGVDNNYVIWDDICWRIIRTTSTGGVKLFYYGEAIDNNGVKTCSDTIGRVAVNGQYSFTYNEPYDSIVDAGYMHNDSYYPVEMDTISGSHCFSEGFTREEEGGYRLIIGDGSSICGDYRDQNNNGHPDVYDKDGADESRHRYFCLQTNTNVCSEIGFVVDPDRSYQYNIYTVIPNIKLPIGDSYPQITQNMFDANPNLYDSNAKTIVDNWFADNITRMYDLEDTVFCNDRTLVSSLSSEFTAYHRYWYQYQDYSPSYDCARKQDSFTVNESTKGNGSLRYPAALVTSDELRIGDFAFEKTRGTLTMSPGRVNCVANSASRSCSVSVAGGVNEYGYAGYIRPVVSLKEGIRFSSGDGKLSSPYIISR